MQTESSARIFHLLLPLLTHSLTGLENDVWRLTTVWVGCDFLVVVDDRRRRKFPLTRPALSPGLCASSTTLWKTFRQIMTKDWSRENVMEIEFKSPQKFSVKFNITFFLCCCCCCLTKHTAAASSSSLFFSAGLALYPVKKKLQIAALFFAFSTLSLSSSSRLLN